MSDYQFEPRIVPGLEPIPQGAPAQHQRLAPAQRTAIETAVYRTPVHSLEATIELRLGGFVTPDGEDDDAGLGEETDDEPSNELPLEELDVEDYDDDPDGDFSEPEDPILLEGMGLDNPSDREPLVDVFVDIVPGNPATLLLRSGISHLLWRFSRGDPLSFCYHDALRKRVVDTIFIAGRIIESNKDFFMSKTKSIQLLRADELYGGGLISQERLSRLRGSACLLTPWNEVLSLERFLKLRAVSLDTPIALLHVLVEQAGQDALRPLHDVELASMMQVLLNEEPGRTTIVSNRDKLGIPNAKERGKAYKEGQSLIEMIHQRKAIDGLLQLKPLLSELENALENQRARETLALWNSTVRKFEKK